MAVRFRGGPLGGEVRVLEKPLLRLRVPSIHRFRVTEASYASAPATVMHDYEEYELGPSYGGGDCRYEYIWINPASHLRERVRELTEDLRLAREACKREARRANELEQDAANWRSLKNLADAMMGPA